MYNCDSDWDVTRTVSLPANFSSIFPAEVSATEIVVSVTNPAFAAPTDNAGPPNGVTRIISSSTSASRPGTAAAASSTNGKPTPNSTGKTNTNIPIIAGVSVGGVIGLALIGLLAFFLYKHYNNKGQKAATTTCSTGPTDPPNPNLQMQYNNAAYMNGTAPPQSPMGVPPQYWQGSPAYMQNQSHDYKGPQVAEAPADMHYQQTPQYASELPGYTHR